MTEEQRAERVAADAALAELGSGLAKDLSEGHYGMSDAIQMIEALSTRLSSRAKDQSQ